MPRGVRENQLPAGDWEMLPFVFKKRVAFFGIVALSRTFESAFRLLNTIPWAPNLNRPISPSQAQTLGFDDQAHMETFFAEVCCDIREALREGSFENLIQAYNLLKTWQDGASSTTPAEPRRHRILTNYENLLLENGTPPTLAQLRHEAGCAEEEVRQFNREAGELDLTFCNDRDRNRIIAHFRKIRGPIPLKEQQDALTSWPNAWISPFDLPLDLFCHLIMLLSGGSVDCCALEIGRSFAKRVHRVCTEKLGAAQGEGNPAIGAGNDQGHLVDLANECATLLRPANEDSPERLPFATDIYGAIAEKLRDSRGGGNPADGDERSLLVDLAKESDTLLQSAYEDSAGRLPSGTEFSPRLKPGTSTIRSLRAVLPSLAKIALGLESHFFDHFLKKSRD